jgi:UDP-N-acetylglucosamine:LPS N-acetylglucosamine transferase
MKFDICLISSSGGHLAQLKKIVPILKKYKYEIITEKNITTKDLHEKNYVRYVYQQERKKPTFVLVFLANLLLESIYFIQTRPRVVITTGAGAVIPFCFIAKIFGAKIIYIESFAKVNTPTITGKIIYRIADRFYIQWIELKKYYPDAIYKGIIY